MAEATRHIFHLFSARFSSGKFSLSEDCKVTLVSSFLHPIKSVEITKSIYGSTYQRASFCLSQWRKLIVQIPELLAAADYLRKDENLQPMIEIPGDDDDFALPLDTIEQVWESCEYITPRYAFKFIPYQSSENRVDLILAARNYTVDGQQKIHPKPGGINLSLKELETLLSLKDTIEIVITTHLNNPPIASPVGF